MRASPRADVAPSPVTTGANAASPDRHGGTTAPAVDTSGIVFGDIGTSPIHASVGTHVEI
jgi:hypothetical protein